MPPISLVIVSDPICPWCFIGKRRLDRALTARPDHPFAVEWRPFMLNPDMPPQGMDRRAYLEAKFGGPDGAAAVYGRIERTAREDGLEIDFAAIARTPSTVDAHRLIGWARAAGADHAMAEAIFAAYFQRGVDIGDRDALAALAPAAGLDPAAARARLDGDEDAGAVRREAEAARAAGVDGAPAFIIGGRRTIAGAQPTAFWLSAIDQLGASARLRRATS